MRNNKMIGCLIVTAALLFAAPVLAEAGDNGPFHTLLKGYDVKTIHAAADHVMFSTLSLARQKSEDANYVASRADVLTGRIDAVSADGILFYFSVYYLDENSCNVRVRAFQKMGVPAAIPKEMLKKYCQLIYDKTVERLEKISAAGIAGKREFGFDGIFRHV